MIDACIDGKMSENGQQMFNTRPLFEPHSELLHSGTQWNALCLYTAVKQSGIYISSKKKCEFNCTWLISDQTNGVGIFDYPELCPTYASF